PRRLSAGSSCERRTQRRRQSRSATTSDAPSTTPWTTPHPYPETRHERRRRSLRPHARLPLRDGGDVPPLHDRTLALGPVLRPPDRARPTPTRRYEAMS